jgi:hypothetical protein
MTMEWLGVGGGFVFAAGGVVLLGREIARGKNGPNAPLEAVTAVMMIYSGLLMATMMFGYAIRAFAA